MKITIEITQVPKGVETTVHCEGNCTVAEAEKAQMIVSLLNRTLEQDCLNRPGSKYSSQVRVSGIW